ncbi:MAG: MarR family transcriptional regulator [Succinivibrio sp.]|nr:MarR family transcriptional regulator [Succinivibrio sp.]
MVSTGKECDPLRLDNQLCFPLYASARRIVAAYTPCLKKLGLTYAQYITLMVLWECHSISMHDLGERLYLDSGTLTPLLKKLESAGYVTRERQKQDERVVYITLTQQGQDLRHEALAVPEQMVCRLTRKGELFSEQEVSQLKSMLYRILAALE